MELAGGCVRKPVKVHSSYRWGSLRYGNYPDTVTQRRKACCIIRTSVFDGASIDLEPLCLNDVPPVAAELKQPLRSASFAHDMRCCTDPAGGARGRAGVAGRLLS